MTAATHIERIRQALEKGPTPGPWNVQPYTWQRGNVSVFAPTFGRAPYGACVAYTACSDGVGGADGSAANASLIAACHPEALTAILADHARLTEALAAAQDALSYARAALEEIVAIEDREWKPMQVFRSDEQVAKDEARHELAIEIAELARAAMKEPTNG